MDSTIDETLKNGISDLTINQLRICGLPLKRHFNITETGRHICYQNMVFLKFFNPNMKRYKNNLFYSLMIKVIFCI